MFTEAVVVEVEAIFLVRRDLTSFMSRRAETLVSPFHTTIHPSLPKIGDAQFPLVSKQYSPSHFYTAT